MALNSPILYDKTYSALIKEAIERIKANCPQYTALLPSDPGVAILDAMIYQLHQLGLSINQLPQASLIAWLSFLQVNLKPATPSKAIIVVTLEEALSEQYIIPSGSKFLTRDGISFTSQNDSVIPAGGLSVEIEVVCEIPGKIGNVPAHYINTPYSLLPYVKSVDNLAPASGGYDGELTDEALERGRKVFAHRYRAVTTSDYETLALEVPGIARSKAIDSVGSVNLYLLDTYGLSAGGELIKNCKDYFQTRTVSGITVNIVPAVFADIIIVANVKFLTGYHIDNIKASVSNNIKAFYDSLSYDWGRGIYISEIMHLIEQTAGVDYCDELVLPASNIAIEKYQLPNIKEVTLNAI